MGKGDSRREAIHDPRQAQAVTAPPARHLHPPPYQKVCRTCDILFGTPLLRVGMARIRRCVIASASAQAAPSALPSPSRPSVPPPRTCPAYQKTCRTCDILFCTPLLRAGMARIRRCFIAAACAQAAFPALPSPSRPSVPPPPAGPAYQKTCRTCDILFFTRLLRAGMARIRRCVIASASAQAAPSALPSPSRLSAPPPRTCPAYQKTCRTCDILFCTPSLI